MMGKFSIYFFVAFILPSIICDPKTLQDCANKVMQIAKDGGVIQEVFKPTGERPIGRGAFGFAYRGILLSNKMEIAMKFTSPQNYLTGVFESIKYMEMQAVNDSNIERYGIPVIYYSGVWGEYGIYMMGISLLDKGVDDLVTSQEIYGHEVNFLIIIRDFILTSKYMHSQGVRHDDIKIHNMMVRKHRTFLIDFNVSSDMDERSRSGTSIYLSRRGHGSGERYPKDDWESFLYSICVALGIYFPWLDSKSMSEMQKLKENTTATVDLIKSMQFETLTSILVPFAEHVFDDGGKLYRANDRKRFPDYNHWYKLVDAKIQEQNVPQPAMFTWLTPEQRKEAIADLKKNPIPDITKIDEPKDYAFSPLSKQDSAKLEKAHNSQDTSSSELFHSAKSWLKSRKGSTTSSTSSAEQYFTCQDGKGKKNIKHKSHK